jgi:hypothetical protein
MIYKMSTQEKVIWHDDLIDLHDTGVQWCLGDMRWRGARWPQQRVRPRMHKETVPCRSRSGDQDTWSSDSGSSSGADDRKAQRVEGSRTIAPDDHIHGIEILHRNTKRVKLYGTKIISGKVTNRKKIICDVRSMRNAIKVEQARKNQVAYWDNR